MRFQRAFMLTYHHSFIFYRFVGIHDNAFINKFIHIPRKQQGCLEWEWSLLFSGFFFKVEGAIKTLRWRRYRVMFCTFCMSLFSLLYMFVINAFPWLAWEEFTVTTRPIKMYVKKICEWNFDCDTHPLAWESVMWKKISLFVVIITVALVIFLHHLLDFFFG